jgi:hypothetical protein
MIDIKEIHEEIKKLESCECTNYDICNKLAILYIIRDHYKPVDDSLNKSMMMTAMSSSPKEI